VEIERGIPISVGMAVRPKTADALTIAVRNLSGNAKTAGQLVEGEALLGLFHSGLNHGAMSLRRPDTVIWFP